MIAKILISFLIVVGCFAIPSIVSSQYTEILDLLQDGILSAGVIVLMLVVIKGWTAITICIIEAFLILIAIIYGINFDNRHNLYVAINYVLIHKVAFVLELAIITARIITGYREIGADYRRIFAGRPVPFFDRRYRERNT